MVAPLPFGQKTRRTGATGPRLARWQSSGALPTIVQSMEALQSLVSWIAPTSAMTMRPQRKA
jgi:hypothetical protein